MESFPSSSPFYGLKISSLDPLRTIKDRHICDGCKRSVRYFCYRCMKLAAELEGQIPQMELPLELVLYFTPLIIVNLMYLESKTRENLMAKLLPFMHNF